MPPRRPPDDLDEQAAYLTAHPEEINEHWGQGLGMFDWVSPPGDAMSCGCLTQVRSGGLAAYTPALTRAIRADARIPNDPFLITPAHFPVFCQWQRKLRKRWAALKGKKP